MTVHAQTWSGPGSDWNTNTNWSPQTVPTGTAIFAGANPTTVTFSQAATSIGTIQFNSGAPAYSFNLASLPPAQSLTITGTGIVNNSANAPTFTLSAGGSLAFQNSSTAANATIINNSGGNLNFHDASTAGNAAITNNGGGTVTFFNGGIDLSGKLTAGNATIFNDADANIFFGIQGLLPTNVDTATAGTATITNNGGVTFSSQTTAGNATIINNNFGFVQFVESSNAGNATITNNAGGFVQFGDSGILGETASAAHATIFNSGTVSFNSATTAGNATIMTNAGGNVFFFDASTGGNARFITNAGGVFDMSGLTSSGMTAGSIEGAGNYFLGSKQFTVGGNNLSTTVSGVISDGGGVLTSREDAPFVGAAAFGGTGGSLIKVGTGTLTLTGANTYTGPTFVNGGILDVNGSLVSAVTVNSGGTLKGNGSIGGLTVTSGGIVAPGNSIGALNVVNGPVSFGPGSIYQVEVNAAGQSDKILATGAAGKATLTGGTVQALPQAGGYAPSTTYTILTANGGVSGTFANATSSSPLLVPSLTYDANDVFLTLRFIQFCSLARTANQCSVGTALQNAPASSALLAAVANQQSPAAILQAFDALSGEIHASAQAAILDDSLYAREALLGRLRQVAFAGGSGPMAALGGGGPTVAYADPDADAPELALAYAGARRSSFPIKAPPRAPRAEPEYAFWAQGIGAWGRFAGDGNAADMRRDLAGFFSGVDRRFGDWRAGIAGGYTNSSVSVSARASSANIDAAHLAAYAGTSFGAWNLRTGADFAWNTISTNRSIIFPGFAEAATARYGAGLGQVFGELGYGVAFGRIAAEPFAGLAYVHLHTDSFAEAGGLAALAGASNTDDVGYSTLGARAATSFLLQNGMVLMPRASAAWMHAFGTIDPTASLLFQSTGTAFTVAGVPLARDSALVSAGADLRVTPQATLGLAYFGQLANSVQDHSVKGNFTWKF